MTSDQQETTPPPHAGQLRWLSPARRGEAGSFAVEFAVAAPALILALLVLAVAAVYATARADVARAAREAARAASLTTSPDQAATVADTTARHNLPGHLCAAGSIQVHTDLSTLTTTPGQGGGGLGLVTVMVSCQLAGVPGNRQVQASGDAVLDEYRGGPTLAAP
ncbi:TadE/TadG family type IV pilus assembly protein [Pseudofrankia sp. BMG5.37]|uniref:TadE/TadG family type IV pilus assembly protein n=1 Tax=Pseudofrankia sp. BMG5.37 TaxID=3050035 RepID=UPI002895AFA5|nr:TadE/TadG family type IV pilus assembly protein [Pseudofrankia sp. BMG5.37]MDT3444497.1 TadE/TadG family type IV pilus assembly protein [Pseudofrankia sp. BMG5.37]